MVVLLALRGLPFAFAMVAVQTIVFGPIDNSKQGPASSIYTTVRQIGASFGVALVATVLISRATRYTPAALRAACAQNPHAVGCVHAQVLGYHDAFIASCALLIVSFFAAFFINDEKARASMRRRVERLQSQTAPVGDREPASLGAGDAAGGA
jgi:hypothetical protein